MLRGERKWKQEVIVIPDYCKVHVLDPVRAFYSNVAKTHIPMPFEK